MSPKLPAVLALSAVLILPLTVAAPAEAAEGVTATHAPAAAHAAKPKPWERLGMSERRWRHCNTKARPCDKRKSAPRVANARAEILRVAASLRGVPYHYGGTSSRGFDCSGYTQYVFHEAIGKHLPRTAEQQRRATHRVRLPRPGDLVFWLSGGVAYHTAIYAGGGKAWAARKTGTTIGIEKVWGTPIYGSALA